METLCEKSKKHFGTTNDLKEAGYILADGIMLVVMKKENQQGKII